MNVLRRLLAVTAFVLLTMTSGCEEATADDCRKDSRCFEIPTSPGTFESKNPSDPCPCA